MARSSKTRGLRPVAVTVDEVPDPKCGLATCTTDAANLVEFVQQPGVEPVRVWRCRPHTHPLHHLIIGPGPA